MNLDLDFFSFNKEFTHTSIEREWKHSFYLSIYLFLPDFLYTTFLIAMEESTRANQLSTLFKIGLLEQE